MVVVNISFTQIEIAKYARGEPVTLKVYFNDGKERSILKTTNFEDAVELTRQVISEIKTLTKQTNAKNTGNIVEDMVQIRLGNDEEESEEKMYRAISRVKEDIKKMRNPGSQGLLQKVAMIQGSKYSI